MRIHSKVYVVGLPLFYLSSLLAKMTLFPRSLAQAHCYSSCWELFMIYNKFGIATRTGCWFIVLRESAGMIVECRRLRLAPGLRSWSRSRIPNNTGSRSRIFCPTPTPEVQFNHFYITLPNWEFLLKCWNRDFLLCTTISIDFNCQISFPLC